tara:strand:- start:466 stop:2628 length:2163 start_codon:yes stop_codon:yes gene_type:complete
MTYELDKNFEEKVYAGVLGKIIGVFLGRPFEGWSYDRIIKELGPINYYVNDKLDYPLPVSDDDITGTFTFLRAFRECNYNKNITAKDIGKTWLNNIIEDKTILWWGGKGHSTEDTAFQNLKQGIDAPDSGSIKTNGKVIAEQIGAQIFIDGWAMVAPGDPEKAIYYAKLAASVSHDGEAIYGAQVIAALESMAFVEHNLTKLVDQAKKFVPDNSVIYKLISDIQEWRSKNLDWKQAREKITENYGYDKYLGNCHIVPNHALIIMALLFGDDDFQKTMMIVNTAGWDTDCNSGNVGCILGIKNGLDGLKSGPDYLSPINDILYCPSALGGETLTDALTETYKIINTTRKINSLEENLPKNGARFHFNIKESTQGWRARVGNKFCETKISNVEYKSALGERGLKISYNNLSEDLISEVYVETFFPEVILDLKGKKRDDFFNYDYISCPIIFPGQKLILETENISSHEISISFFSKHWGKDDKLIKISSNLFKFQGNEKKQISWDIPNTGSNPVGQIGINITSNKKKEGKVILNFMNFEGEPKQIFKRPDHLQNYQKGEKIKEGYYGEIWRNAWVQYLDKWEKKGKNFRICQNKDRGILYTGTDLWKNYSISSKIMLQSGNSGGLVSRVQGVKKYYTYEVCKDNKLRIGKMNNDYKILKEVEYKVEFFKEYNLKMKLVNNKIIGYIDNKVIIDVDDFDFPFTKGGAGLGVNSGTLVTEQIILS